MKEYIKEINDQANGIIADQPNKCPVCGEEIGSSQWGDLEPGPDAEAVFWRFTCDNCGAEGKESWNLHKGNTEVHRDKAPKRYSWVQPERGRVAHVGRNCETVSVAVDRMARHHVTKEEDDSILDLPIEEMFEVIVNEYDYQLWEHIKRLGDYPDEVMSKRVVEVCGDEIRIGGVGTKGPQRGLS